VNVSINERNVPPEFPIQFTTSAFGLFVPGLADKFPGMNMSAMIGPYVPPVGAFHAANGGGLAINATIEADFYVDPPNAPTVFVFALLINAAADGLAFLTGNAIGGQINNATITLSLLRSAVGDFNVAPMQEMVLLALNDFALPLLNSVLAKGAPLPLPPTLQLPGAHIGYFNGYLAVSTSVKYTPPHVKAGRRKIV